MNKIRFSSRTATPLIFMMTILLTGALAMAPVTPAIANDKQEAAQIVEKARLTLESFMSDSTMGAFRNLIRKADGVFIAPQVLKGAFVVGASGGNGISPNMPR